MKTKRVDSLNEGDSVVREGWTDTQNYIREVVGRHEIKDQVYYVLSGRRGQPGDHPQIVSAGAIERGEWRLVVPEPRKVAIRQWYRESDGTRVAWYPDDSGRVNADWRRKGYILVEVEGVEVQS